MSNLNDLDITEELKSVKYITLLISFITTLSLIVEKIQTKELVEIFTFLEIIFFIALFKSYLSSIKKFNYGLWGISFIIFLIIARNIIHFSFAQVDVFLIYMNIFSLILFGINSYVMSSPLYYSRVQWWEYDYKFRADLKVLLKFDEDTYEGRLTDLRRSEASVDAFEHINLEATGELFVEGLEGVSFQVKSSREIINGRPIRYGIRFYKKDENFIKLKENWLENKNVKIRHEFKK